MSFKPDAFDWSRYGETWEEEQLPDPKEISARVRGWVNNEREFVHRHWTLDVADTLDRLIAENERLTAALAATPAPAPDRLTRIGAYVIEFAKKVGWEDGGDEGAFEFIQRVSYELGMKDRAATPAPAPHPDTVDAERYRWLRDNPTHESVPYFEGGQWLTPYLVGGSGSGGGGVGTRHFDTLDAAIDAARAGQGKEASK